MAGHTQRLLGYRGQQVLAFVNTTIDEQGTAPSYSQIRDALGFQHKGHVHCVVVRLEQRGLLVRSGIGPAHRIRLPA